jgi:NAD(P)-dependent dehydrogenase (short-subunit alcohol dehydrogenase family)
VTRAVLVTVGTGGLGAAVTNRFLEDGHNVVLASKVGGTSETATGSLTHFGEQLHLLQADVTEWDSGVELVERTVARLGTIEVLIHLVEGWGGRPAAAGRLARDLGRMFAVNLRSAFLCSGAVLPIMRQ